MGTHDYGSQGWWVYAAAANERNLLDECVRLRRASERGRSGAGSAAEITLREADGRWARRRRRSKRYGGGAAATLTVAKHSIDTFFGIQHV